MSVSRDELELPASNATEPAGHKKWRLKIAGAILAVTATLLVAAQWRPGELNAARIGAPAGTVSSEAAAFDYFPAQFGTPVANSTPEEHVQAF